MDSRFAFEVGCTLCLQISVVVSVTLVLQRWITDARSQCRLWTICFVCVIGLFAAGLLLPHRRLFDFPGDWSRESMLRLVVWQTRIAIGLASVWAIGAAWSVLRRVMLCIGLLRFLKTQCEPIDTEALLKRTDISVHRHHPSASARVERSRSHSIHPPSGRVERSEGRAGTRSSKSLPGRYRVRPSRKRVGEFSLENLSILTSDRIQGPFCWQLHRPVIVLPTFLLTDDDQALRHVLLHEIEHLRTRHPMQHFLQGVCSTVFWFHPMVWMAARGAELTREYLCDEVAAKTAGKFGAYLRTLAKVAERCGSVSCTEVPKGTLAFGNQPSALVRRSNRLVELAEGERPQSRWCGIAAMAVLLLCAVLIQQVWLPTNAMASQRSDWSPWPTWTASALHEAGVHVRDFELFEDRVQMHELLYDED